VSFKYECDSHSSRQTTSVFHIDHSLSWQSIDLFLGLFSGFGRSLDWEVDNLVEFVHIFYYFMIYEHYISDSFHSTFPQNYCHSFPENQFCEVLFALKTSGYLFLARNLMAFASHKYEEIFILKTYCLLIVQLISSSSSPII